MDVNKLEENSPEDLDTIVEGAEEQYESEKEKLEGLTFYNTDLYDSPDKLTMFPEKVKLGLSEETKKADIAQQNVTPTAEQIHSDLQKEVDELAKQYGISDDKEKDEHVFLASVPSKNPEITIHKPTAPKREKKLLKRNKSIEASNKIGQHQNTETSTKTENNSPKSSVLGEHGSLRPKEIDQPGHHQVKELEKDGGHVGSEENVISDIYCITCKTPVKAVDKLFGVHKDHEVMGITTAVEQKKEEMRKNMSKLEEQIVQMENFANHLEEIYITVEENFTRQEQNAEMHFTEVMDALNAKHEEKIQVLGEEKKLKLESLFEQLIDCGKSLDTSKDLMETIQELFKEKDKAAFVNNASQTTNRLNDYFNTDINLNISTNAEYENTSIDFTEVEHLLDSIHTVPAPSAPVINPQTPNSATATSLRVCWSLFSDDTVESFQLYYKPVCDCAPGEDQEEVMIRSKETYCTVTNLMPNTQYEFWVTALNVTGDSPASENAVYVTAPSPPIIKSNECRSCENAALICWESGNINPVDSYTVEIYKVTDGTNADSVTESIVGIPICESLIQLQPSQTYRISVKAVNVGGPSESSKSISIHTAGTFFHLDEETAHPLLSVTDDGFTISCAEEESLVDLPYYSKRFSRCIAVLGKLIPFKGKHYWEVEVDENTQYRIGIAYEDTNRNGLLGANSTSWCLRHILTPSRHKYEFLHCGVSPDTRITIPPRRIGILLDYDKSKLSFFNMDLEQHLFTFICQFCHMVHPCFGLEKPGRLKIRNGIPIPHSVLLSS
ncbi:fibronectin type III and SPRY domain-containing protein 2 [Xenopus laevis]|uniref:Fibronectin type III and SPRY domain-containing protein 2 n=2 Tax=Xenopus laevis TaxID=8355 RepID=A0A1L8H0M3_XENLA|nr:fibronectin type III and SPRY domain-containing protein 2 [Xenopus laevis]XP_041442732.1 fibronectin type III and SPRY domain-containing protein 2 [Xenopus laevis]OCT89645.1 hypothetical protein XELAEV_18018263mg [Xenopus laevis]